MTLCQLIKSSSLSRTKLEQMSRSKTIPAFYLSVEGWRLDLKLGTVYYTVEIGIELEQEVVLTEKEYRYSDLLKFHKLLESHLNNVPSFPPKKIFGSKDQSFIRKRQTDLQKYFSKISEIENITRFPPFISFFN